MQDLEDSVANTGLADIPPPVHDKVCSEPMERLMLSIAVDSRGGSIDGGEWSMNMTSFAYALLLITRAVETAPAFARASAATMLPPYIRVACSVPDLAAPDTIKHAPGRRETFYCLGLQLCVGFGMARSR